MFIIRLDVISDLKTDFTTEPAGNLSCITAARFYFSYLMFGFCLCRPYGLLWLTGGSASSGSVAGFYQWSRGVQIRANLDLLMDWVQNQGLANMAAQFLQKLSAAVNLLATPKETLLQVSSHLVGGATLSLRGFIPSGVPCFCSNYSQHQDLSNQF